IRSCRDTEEGCDQAGPDILSRRIVSRCGVRPRLAEPGAGVNRGQVAASRPVAIRSRWVLVSRPSEITAYCAVATSGGGPSPEKRDLPFFSSYTSSYTKF
ncbi:hypothetical protein Taro_033936, partial [Colocasia esculenta]|nr:hypothetical protein [Colocasia esculenta]